MKFYIYPLQSQPINGSYIFAKNIKEAEKKAANNGIDTVKDYRLTTEKPENGLHRFNYSQLARLTNNWTS